MDWIGFGLKLILKNVTLFSNMHRPSCNQPVRIVPMFILHVIEY